MNKIIILSANLGDFDDSVDPVKQDIDCDFHRYTDKDFPPIAGLSSRLQYRIPKTHGWQMYPGYDVYIWMDGGITFKREDSVKWYLEQLGDKDMLVFKHPWRKTIKEEVEHIEERLKNKDRYITPRYKNGLHREFYEAMLNLGFENNFFDLYASTIFVYRNTPKVRRMMEEWLYTSVRYFTCDQVPLPYLIYKHSLDIKVIEENPFNFKHSCLIAKHKRLE